MDTKQGARTKRTVFVSLAVLAMGIPPLVNSLGNPRLAGLRGPDILRLAAIGFCVGVAFAAFAMGTKQGTLTKRTVFVSLAVLAMGIPPLVNSLGNPRLAGLRGPDILRLTAIGFCVGVAFGLFVGLYRHHRSPP